MTPLIVIDQETKEWYVATRYRKDRDGFVTILKKFCVTDQVKNILKQKCGKRKERGMKGRKP